jgi:hypothetical protein
MGLDTVELVMEIEDEFGIRIADDEAERITTVGQTVECVARHLAARRPPGPVVCTSARAFYRLRAALGERFNVPRSAVRPGTPVGTLVPACATGGDWHDVVARCDLRPEPFRWSSPFARQVPPPGTTVRELIAARSTGRAAGDDRFAGPNGQVALRLIFEKLAEVVSEQAGVKASDIGWDTRYVQDLNMG